MPGEGGMKGRAGFVLGILFFLFIMVAPFDMDMKIRGAMATLFLCATWWVTEAIPVYATALLPAVMLPLLGILPLQEALNQYAHRIIFLFLGGFLIARAMIKWGLDRRIAIAVLSRGGKNARVLVLHFMIVTAFLSAFISNTATTAMMLPIGMAVLIHMEGKKKTEYGKALMLGIAYAATIGGVATLIGTPPNAIFAGFSENLLGREITFFEWLKIGLPFSAIMLPIAWKFLMWRYDVKDEEMNYGNYIVKEKNKLGKMGREERLTVLIFIMVAVLWITYPFWDAIPFQPLHILQERMDDAVIAMLGAQLLFIIPVNVREWKFVLSWDDAMKIPIGILILFGGGLCLGKGLFESGAAEWIASVIPLISLPIIIIIMVALVSSFLSEVASNTAVANMLMPIFIAMAGNAGMNPYVFLIPATLSCSIAFMFPISTPPNAIVYSSGHLKMEDMVKNGFMLHLIGLVVVVALTYFLTGKIVGMFPV